MKQKPYDLEEAKARIEALLADYEQDVRQYLQRWRKVPEKAAE